MESEMDQAPTRWDFESGELPYRTQLYKTALRMARSVEEAEDLLQETFLKAFKYYARFEEGTNLKAWLFRIMKNAYINTYRRNKRLPRHVEFDELHEGFEESEVAGDHWNLRDSEGEVIDSSVDQEVRDALLALPHDYKMAVLLVDLKGYTYQEAAGILAVPVGTVMSRLFRGRKKLERALLSFGRRYNYLTRPPERLRNHDINLAEFFDLSE
jgi:RNA polymerase sigma-70 factor (ECF subfamily)